MLLTISHQQIALDQEKVLTTDMNKLHGSNKHLFHFISFHLLKWQPYLANSFACMEIYITIMVKNTYGRVLGYKHNHCFVNFHAHKNDKNLPLSTNK